jgi:predicted PurR-regulated permease PerM
MLSTLATVALFVFVIIFAVIAVALLAAVAIALRKISDQVEKLTTMAEPAIAKASNTLDTVQRVTMTVGEKADAILTRSETMTDNVSDRVERTASVVQQAVTMPLVNLSSWIAGVSKGFSVYGGTVSGKRNGHAATTDTSKE